MVNQRTNKIDNYLVLKPADINRFCKSYSQLQFRIDIVKKKDRIALSFYQNITVSIAKRPLKKLDLIKEKDHKTDSTES